MEITADDALSLLRKWYDERTPLKVFLMLRSTAIAVEVSGFVNALARDILISDGTTSPADPMHNYIIFPAQAARSFEYVEAKDLKTFPPEARNYLAAHHGSANLQIQLEGGISISFFERATP